MLVETRSAPEAISVKKVERAAKYIDLRMWKALNISPCVSKGQLISKGLFSGIVSTKKPTKFF